MITRTRHIDQVLARLRVAPVVAIIGARQVGKTTMAQQVARQFDGPITRFDLEDPDDLSRLQEPKLALQDLRGLIILDEVQRRPDLFNVLRVLVDRPGDDTRFVVLGSASPELLRQSSESLAGRIGFHRLDGFALDEVGTDRHEDLWLRGGFPRSFLAATVADSVTWRKDFVQTFLERDIPQLGVRIPAQTLRRFWRMLAHYHGQIWNGAELARGLGVTGGTVRRYLDILTSALVVRQLNPWHANVGKRQIKSPKVYLADTGLLHVLLGLATRDDLVGHPKVGSSWEGFVISELTNQLGASGDECFFWATHTGAELDLLFVRGMRRLGFEIKRTTSPRSTRSMLAAMEALGLERLDVIHAGEHTFQITASIRAVAFRRIHLDIAPL